MAAPKKYREGSDAFSRVSGMPPEYFENFHGRYAASEMSSLRVFLALRTAARRIDNAVAGWLDRSGLTVTKVDVLHLLAAAGPQGATIGRLSDFLKMTQPNVTFVMQSLEREELVRRLSDPADRRSSIFFITKSGLARIDDITPKHVAAIAAALRPLRAADRDFFIEMLAAITERFEDTLPP